METCSSLKMNNVELSYCYADACATYELYKHWYYEQLERRVNSIFVIKENKKMTNAEKFLETFGVNIRANGTRCMASSVCNEFDCHGISCDECNYNLKNWTKEEYKKPIRQEVIKVKRFFILSDVFKFIEEEKICDRDILSILPDGVFDSVEKLHSIT